LIAAVAAHDVGDAIDGLGALVSVIVAGEDDVDPSADEDRHHHIPHLAVLAVGGGAEGWVVEEDEPPGLPALPHVLLQPWADALPQGLLAGGAVDGGDVAVSIVEAVVPAALQPWGTVERHVEDGEGRGAILGPNVVVAQRRPEGHPAERLPVRLKE